MRPARYDISGLRCVTKSSVNMMRSAASCLCALLLLMVASCEGRPKEDATKPMTSTEMKEINSMIKEMQKQSMGKPDPNMGQVVASVQLGGGKNADEMGSYMEGDILTLSYDEEKKVRWPGGVVVYKIEGDFNSQELEFISEATRHIEQHSCIRFRRYSGSEEDYVTVSSKSSGCWSAIGRTGGEQSLNLQNPNCLFGIGTIVHEFLHTLGFPHEQTRRDRNDYVTIEWENIHPYYQFNFRQGKFSGLGVRYDYDSVMHYSKFAFSVNDQPSITTRNGEEIGQRRGLSPSDIRKLNRLYECDVARPPRPEPEITEPRTTTVARPTRPEHTRPTRPEPTRPTRPEPTRPTRPEPTRPTRPEPTRPTRPEPTRPTRPEPTRPRVEKTTEMWQRRTTEQPRTKIPISLKDLYKIWQFDTKTQKWYKVQQQQ